MAKHKVGTLKPAIDQLRKRIEEKREALTLRDRRSLTRKLRRLQRKVRTIRATEASRAARTKKAGGEAPAEAS